MIEKQNDIIIDLTNASVHQEGIIEELMKEHLDNDVQLCKLC